MPKIDITKITGYEAMTAEEKIAALEGFDVEFDTTGWVKKSVYDKTASDLADLKKTAGAQTTAAKTADEKIKDLEKKLAVNDLEKKFIAAGYSEEDANKAATAYYDNDPATVVALQTQQLEKARKAAAAETMKKTPPPNNGVNVTTNSADYNKQIEQAQANGDFALAASLMTQMYQANQNENGGTD